MQLDGMMEWIAVSAAVGTAAMGLVEAAKAVTLFGWSLATIGVGKVRKQLGADAMQALDVVYGTGAGAGLVEGAWRKGPEHLAQVLRNGLRMAVFAEPGHRVVAAFGQDPAAFAAAVAALRPSGGAAGGTAPADQATARELVARLEAAIDARVDAAVAAGRDLYVSAMQCAASVVAIGGCVLMYLPGTVPEELRPRPWVALFVGLLAVPIAPIAKDLVAFLTSLRSAFAAKVSGA